MKKNPWGPAKGFVCCSLDLGMGWGVVGGVWGVVGWVWVWVWGDTYF